MVYDVITFSRYDIYVISPVYDKCVKDANGHRFPDALECPVPCLCLHTRTCPAHIALDTHHNLDSQCVNVYLAILIDLLDNVLTRDIYAFHVSCSHEGANLASADGLVQLVPLAIMGAQLCNQFIKY